MQVTNILALPLATMSIITGSNEDWIDVIKYVVSSGGDDSNIDALPQLDLRGIKFQMEVRRQVEEHEVVVSASTADGKLAVGNPPNLGYLLINVPAAEMNFPGEYVGDIVASDEIYSRVAVQFTLQIVTGITRNP